MDGGESGPVRVAVVRTARQLEAFIEFAYRLNGRLAHWVPPLRRDVRRLLDRKVHPFHQHAAVEYFVALRGGRIVGRIAAIENHAHNSFHRERAAHFGFLEAEDDETVFRALLRAVEVWARSRGLDHVYGPCSFSTNEECGFLVEGYDADPSVMMPWTPPNYPAKTERCGYTKAHDLYSWIIDKPTYLDRIPRLAERVRTRIEKQGARLECRTLNMARFDEDLGFVRQVYNSAWQHNWGFVPMTKAEVDYLAAELKPMVEPQLVLFATIDGEPAGFLLGLPDYNVILKHLDGRLGPAQLVLYGLLRKQVKRARMLAMGVVEKFRSRGIETVMIDLFARHCVGMGINEAELGWVLDSNDVMNRGIKATGARIGKVHRIYGKSLEKEDGGR